MKVNFYDHVEDQLLRFAVIIAQHGGKWVFCKHWERDTYELPGGHREPGEEIWDTARRELQEETGAVEFSIHPVCVYSVIGKNRVNQSGEECYGMLYVADIVTFQKELHSEMEQVLVSDDLPTNWTYPDIQPLLVEEYLRRKIECPRWSIGWRRRGMLRCNEWNGRGNESHDIFGNTTSNHPQLCPRGCQ